MKITDLTEARFGLNNKQRAAYAKKVATHLDGDVDAALEKYGPQIATALKQFKKGNRIFRGVPTEGVKAMVIDPTKIDRKAANTYNYMNILQATLPSWKEYPRRTRSLICTTAYSTAAAYAYDGKFAVLPFGNPTVGIVPGEDWYDSYVRYMGPSSINKNLADFYRTARNYGFKGQYVELPETKPQFYEALTAIQNWAKSSPDKVKLLLEEYPFRFMLDLVKFPNWVEGLNSLLDPASNGFKMVPLSKFKPNRNIEVWISSPALLVDADTMIKKFNLDK